MNPIVKSLAALCVVSTGAALCFSSSLTTFIKLFLAVTIIQVVAYNIYQQVVFFLGQKIINERISEYSKQGLEVTCPCSRAIKNLIPIQLNTDNSYRCLECSRNVSVSIDVKTYLETQPIDLDKSNDALVKTINTVTQDGI